MMLMDNKDDNSVDNRRTTNSTVPTVLGVGAEWRDWVEIRIIIIIAATATPTAGTTDHVQEEEEENNATKTKKLMYNI